MKIKTFFKENYKKLLVATVLALALAFVGSIATQAAASKTAPATGDIWFGDGGLYIPGEAGTGTVTISRPSVFPAGVRMSRKPVHVDFSFNGAAYVYFNLQKHERAIYDDGRLSVYYNAGDRTGWWKCPATFFLDTENLPVGRLTCYTGPKDGFYVLGFTKK
jgi:hypothetical protein